MSDDAAMKEAMQKQALRLKEEFPNLEEIRSVVKPSYDRRTKRAFLQFETPYGTCLVGWDGQRWNVRLPNQEVEYVLPGTLRAALQKIVEKLRDEAILTVMEQQAAYLRGEFYDLEELFGWARPLYNYEEQRAEVRFDTSSGLCRFWREGQRWKIHMPDGTEMFVQPGELNERLSFVRKHLRRGIV